MKVMRNGWCKSDDCEISGERGPCDQGPTRYDVLQYYGEPNMLNEGEVVVGLPLVRVAR